MNSTNNSVRPYRMGIGTIRALRKCLKSIRHADSIKHYEWRNAAVYHALAIAASLDMPCGIEIDPEEPQWPVIYIELPTGQVSWHVPAHSEPYDGHTTSEKYRRIQAWLEMTGEEQRAANGFDEIGDGE